MVEHRGYVGVVISVSQVIEDGVDQIEQRVFHEVHLCGCQLQGGRHLLKTHLGFQSVVHLLEIDLQDMQSESLGEGHVRVKHSLVDGVDAVVLDLRLSG